MSSVTREEVIELLRNFQQRMAAKRGMCDEHDGALWDSSEAVIAALQAAVPEGWKLVPVEPTDHMSDVGMVSAGIDITENDARHVYSAMLDASPQPAPTAVPGGWHISRTEGGNIIVQKSHVAGFVASEQSGGIAESTLYYLADDLLTASPCPPAKAQVPDEAFNLIEAIRAELTWPGWRKTSSRDWVMDSLSELLSMLTASPDPDHFAHVRNMVAPDVSELEKAAQKLWRESYNCESDFIQAVVDAFSKQEEEEPVVQQHYPCGCVTCICEDDVQCQGCGGTSCDDFKGPSCGCTHLKEEAER